MGVDSVTDRASKTEVNIFSLSIRRRQGIVLLHLVLQVIRFSYLIPWYLLNVRCFEARMILAYQSYLSCGSVAHVWVQPVWKVSDGKTDMICLGRGSELIQC